MFCAQLRGERSAGLVPVRVNGRKRVVAPEGLLRARRVVRPAVLRVAHHDPRLVVDRVVDPRMILPPVDRCVQRGHPVVAAALRRRGIGQRIELQGQQTCRAQAAGWNLVAREGLAGQWIDRSGIGTAVDQGAAEVSGALGRRRHERGPGHAALLAVPLLGGEELELVLDDRSAEGAAEVVNAQRSLRLIGQLQEIVASTRARRFCPK